MNTQETKNILDFNTSAAQEEEEAEEVRAGPPPPPPGWDTTGGQAGTLQATRGQETPKTPRTGLAGGTEGIEDTPGGMHPYPTPGAPVGPEPTQPGGLVGGANQVGGELGVAGNPPAGRGGATHPLGEVFGALERDFPGPGKNDPTHPNHAGACGEGRHGSRGLLHQLLASEDNGGFTLENLELGELSPLGTDQSGTPDLKVGSVENLLSPPGGMPVGVGDPQNLGENTLQRFQVGPLVALGPMFVPEPLVGVVSSNVFHTNVGHNVAFLNLQPPQGVGWVQNHTLFAPHPVNLLPLQPLDPQSVLRMPEAPQAEGHLLPPMPASEEGEGVSTHNISLEINLNSLEAAPRPRATPMDMEENPKDNPSGVVLRRQRVPGSPAGSEEHQQKRVHREGHGGNFQPQAQPPSMDLEEQSGAPPSYVSTEATPRGIGDAEGDRIGEAENSPQGAWQFLVESCQNVQDAMETLARRVGALEQANEEWGQVPSEVDPTLIAQTIAQIEGGARAHCAQLTTYFEKK